MPAPQTIEEVRTLMKAALDSGAMSEGMAVVLDDFLALPPDDAGKLLAGMQFALNSVPQVRDLLGRIDPKAQLASDVGQLAVESIDRMMKGNLDDAHIIVMARRPNTHDLMLLHSSVSRLKGAEDVAAVLISHMVEVGEKAIPRSHRQDGDDK
jgi:hypothetical protein